MGYRRLLTATSPVHLVVLLLWVAAVAGQPPNPATVAVNGFSRVGFARGPRRAGSWCASEDSGARAYAAGVVFEGKARSRSPPGPGGVYYVTFVVQRVYKDNGGGVLPERLLKTRSQVRLPFVAGPPPAPPSPARCEDMARIRAPAPSVVRANLKQGGKFFVFADHVGTHNLTVRGPPMPRTRSSAQSVSAVLCPKCVRPPGIWGLRNRSVTARRKLRLACRTTGSPSPAVVWLKDGRRIASTLRRSISHTRKRSTLSILRVRLTDAGVYECRAVSVTGEAAVSIGRISVHRPTPAGPRSPTLNGSSEGKDPLDSQPCKTESYCLHGGTCKYFETIGEQVCVCAKGFKGPQCESKEVDLPPSDALSIPCGLGASGTYYC